MDCDDRLTLRGTVEVAAGVHTMHICDEDRCSDGEFGVGHCVELEGDLDVIVCIGPPVPPELPPPMYTRQLTVEVDPTQADTGDTVTMVLADPDGNVLVEVDERVQFEPQYLNGGPECGVTCRVAEVEL